MDKERIKTVVNALDKSGAETKASIWLMDLIPDAYNHEKHLQRLRKAQGLINKVKRDLGRLV